MIEGYAFTSITQDIHSLCAAAQQFLDASSCGDTRLASGHVMQMALWKRKVDDSFEEIRAQVETDDGLPWGRVLNAAVEFGQLTRELSNEGDDYPTVAEWTENIPLLMALTTAHFDDLLACEAASALNS